MDQLNYGPIISAKFTFYQRAVLLPDSVIMPRTTLQLVAASLTLALLSCSDPQVRILSSPLEGSPSEVREALIERSDAVLEQEGLARDGAVGRGRNHSEFRLVYNASCSSLAGILHREGLLGGLRLT